MKQCANQLSLLSHRCLSAVKPCLVNLKPDFPTQFLACLLCNWLTDPMFEDWETSHLDGKCPSQVGNVYDRQYGPFMLLASPELES